MPSAGAARPRLRGVTVAHGSHVGHDDAGRGPLPSGGSTATAGERHQRPGEVFRGAPLGRAPREGGWDGAASSATVAIQGMQARDLGLLTVVLAGCSAAGPAPAPPPPPPAPAPALALAEARAPRYVARPGPGWIERTGEGIDRVVLSTRRAEIRGMAVAPVGAAEPPLDAGVAVPAWAAGAPGGAAPAPGAGPTAPAQYVFWSGKDVYAAARFDGDLEKIATLPSDVQRAFDWLDGIGIVTASGTFTVRAADRAVRPLGVPGAIEALAADARRALVLTVFGHARLTLDGGASYRDATAELDSAVHLEAYGDELAVRLQGGRQRFLGPDGVLRDARVTSSARRGEPPREVDPRWPDGAGSDALDLAVTSGVPLADGGAVVTAAGWVGRVDLETGLTTSAAPLPPGMDECAPLRGPEAMLAVCVGPERAIVLDLTGEPRVERSFALAPPPAEGDAPRASWRVDRDRFVGADGEALGYLGPCEGAPRPSLDLDAISNGSTYNPSVQQSPVLCARQAPGVWIEHRLDPEDATDVVAWVPRRGGDAVALVARPGPFLTDDARLEVRGALRVVRFARSEPPVMFPQYRYGTPSLLSRAFVARADGSLEGWMPVQSSTVNLLAVRVDSAGRLHARLPPPRANAIHPAGPSALLQTDDGLFFETSDFGRRWVEAAPPPGDVFVRASGCSAVGCRIGSLLRLGWADPRDPAAARAVAEGPPAADPLALARVLRDRRQYRRPPSLPPVARLACEIAGPAEGTRLPDSFGFGVTPAPVPRGVGAGRLGTLGVLVLPWSGGPQLSMSGDADLAWIAPFDLRARIRRATIPLASAALSTLTYRDATLGYVIDREGHVAPVAAGSPESCLSGLLDPAGVSRPLGGCAPLPAVGVDLGDRVVLLGSSHRGHTVSVVDLHAGKGALAPPPRELHAQPIAHGESRFAYGAGARGGAGAAGGGRGGGRPRPGAPVFVAVGGLGDAVLTPVDPERGTFGPAERLAPLGELRAGSDPRCAPRPDQARVVLPFETEIGLAPGALPGVVASGTAGLAVIRWSATAACLDAIELGVRDERYEGELGYYEPSGTVKKIVAHLSGPPPLRPILAGRGDPGRPEADEGASSARAEPRPPRAGAGAALIVVTQGQEIRQRLSCRVVAP